MPRYKTKSVIKKIKKRDGRIVAFDISKIERAIWLAAKAAGGENRKRAKYLASLVVGELEERFNKTIIPEVEQVQDIVETILLQKGHERTYRAYILYRDLHGRLRDISSLVDSDELIQKYLDKASWLVKENANMTYSLQGLNNHVASIISSNFWLNKIYPRQVRKAHSYGDLHIHDLALLSAYCTGWDLKDLLIRGFGGVRGKVNSAPPKHFGTALGQLVNFVYSLQGEVAGACAVSNFDTYLAPFIAYDKLSYKQVKQTMQEFVYNMNVPTRVGFQSPFSNCTIDLIPPRIVGGETVIIGGKPTNNQYKGFQREMDMFNKAFAEVMLEGDSQGRVFTFPIPTYSITKNFNWDNPVLEPIFEMTRRYGIPYFCLAEDTLVCERKKGKIPIDLIKKSDELLTEDGYQKVKRVFKLTASELIKIKLENKESIDTTPTHCFPTISKGLKKSEELTLKNKLIYSSQRQIVFSSNIILKEEDEANFTFYVLKKDRLEEKNLRDLKESEAVFIKNKANFLNKVDISGFRFNESIYANNTKQIKIPKKLTGDLARLLGYLIGDGSYSGKGKRLPLVTFVNADRDILEDFTSLVNKLFGPSLKIEKRQFQHSKSYMLTVHSVMFRQFLEFLGLGYVKASQKSIPQLIYQTTAENTGQLLRGLFDTDGTVDKKGNIGFVSANFNLAKQVWYLLAKLGILSRFIRLTEKRREDYGKAYILGSYATDFAKKIGFTSMKKRDRLKKIKYKRPNVDSFYGLTSLLKTILPEKRGEVRGKLRSVWEKAYYRSRAKITNEDLEVVLRETKPETKGTKTLRFIYKNKLFGDRVKKIQESKQKAVAIESLDVVKGRFKVVDVTIDSHSHLFSIGSGILTHNSNFVNSDMKPEDVRSMCCRLRLSNKVLRKRGGLFAAHPLTGSIGVVTINLARIGYLAKTKKEFLQRLKKLMRIARGSLLIKRKAVEEFTERGLYPYCRYYLSDVKKRTGKYWSNHFNTIGINGMSEAVENLLGKDIVSPEGRDFALQVMDFMLKRILDFQKKTKQLFNLEATPAEGTSYRFARVDKQKYPDIITANEEDLGKDNIEPFYTNSTHMPVDYTDDIFEALDHQDELQCKYNGGTVLHGFLGESLPDTRTVKKMVKKIAQNYHLPYFTLTPTFSVCPKHGYLKGEWKYCPKCDGEMGYDTNLKFKMKNAK